MYQSIKITLAIKKAKIVKNKVEENGKNRKIESQHQIRGPTCK